MIKRKTKTPSFVVCSSLLLLILLARLSLAQNATDRLLPVEVDGKHGFISTRGEIVIPLSFEFAWGFHEGLASAWRDGKAGFIGKSGEVVIPPQFAYALAFVYCRADLELGTS